MKKAHVVERERYHFTLDSFLKVAKFRKDRIKANAFYVFCVLFNAFEFYLTIGKNFCVSDI